MKCTKHDTLGGRAYPVRHYPVAMRLRTRKGCAILCIAPSPQSGDSSGAILGVRSVALLHLGSSLVINTEEFGKVQGKEILKFGVGCKDKNKII